MDDNYNILIKKLDEFIRKFYKNQLLKGLIYAVAALLTFYLVINILEYFAWFGSVVRGILFWLYILVNAVILYRLVLIPLFHLYRIGKILSYEQAAKVIGEHFQEVQDTLLNTLQLQKQKSVSDKNLELLEASINQKIKKLKPIPFASAIDLKKNRKYLRYALPPALILLVLIIAAPGVVTEPTKRLAKYNTYFEKPAPFTFEILNKNLDAVQQEDFVLDVKLSGQEIPEQVFIVFGDSKFRLNKESNILFHYTFKNVQKNIKFYLTDEHYRSRDYMLNVIPKPMILNFDIELVYPAYVQKKNETLQNSGDIVVPQGTKATWFLKTRDTEKILFRFADGTFIVEPKQENAFVFSHQCMQSLNYSISTLNSFFRNKDSMLYTISVIPDNYPVISVEEYKDSVYEKRLYFSGMIKDDYGCSKLLFKYRLLPQGETFNENNKEISNQVPIIYNATQQQFYYFFDMGELDIKPGDAVEYYFEVWDNDAVNGNKSTRSQKIIFKVPTLDEIEKQAEQTADQIKQQLEDAYRQTQLLQRELDKLDRKIAGKKELTWQEKKQIQDILDRQQMLQQKIEDLKQLNLQNNIREQQFKNIDESLLEKQRMLEKLFDEIMTDEMKELFKKLQEMLDKIDKDKVNDVLDKMKLTNEDIQKALDRNLELFKSLEVDKKLQDVIDKLDKLAQEQQKLAQESKNENAKADSLKKKQDALNQQFEEFRKDMDELHKKNSELEEPKSIKSTDAEESSIEQHMKNSSEELQKNKKKNASQSQQNAAEEMEQLSKKLKQMQQDIALEEYEEDIQALRQILENLIKVSFEQEEHTKQITKVNTNDPRYISLMDKQKEIKDNLSMIKDSLFALSKRQPMIESVVNREINQIETNLKKALEALHARNTPAAAAYGQYVMTSVNNLALLLAESLNQLQDKQQQCMNSKGCKGGKCKKPGSGKPSATSMKELQQQINKKLEELKKQLEGKKPGEQQGKGQQSISEQLARLAAEQEALRRMLQQYGEEDKKEGGKNSKNISEMLKAMEQTEQDIVNKMITNETLKRQKEILTRLLESEKAEKERELDEKRESNEAKNTIYSNPNEFFKYNRIKSKEVEMIKTIPPTLKSFYKKKVNEYFYNFAE